MFDANTQNLSMCLRFCIICCVLFCFRSGAVFPAIFIMAASYAGYDKVPVIIWFTFTVAFLGNFYPGLKVNALDLTPNYAGSLMALTNGIGGFTGIAVPPFVGRMTPDVRSLDKNHCQSQYISC